MKIIEVRDFSFRYANGSRESLSHVSLDVEEGTFNVLCGKEWLWQEYAASPAEVGSGSFWQQFRENLLLWAGFKEVATGSRARKLAMYCKIPKIRS